MAVQGSTSVFRISRSALWHSPPEHEKEKRGDDVTWTDLHDGHDSGYMLKKDGHQEKDESRFSQAAKHEVEQHALKSAAGAGKHAAAAAEEGAHKHADQASALGKGPFN